MKFYPVEPRSAALAYHRLGIPTSSDFKRVLTAGGKKSDQQEDYAHKLLAAQMLGRPLENDIQTGYMVRGQEEEDSAIEAVEFEMGLNTSLGGFCVSDDGEIGCSPDRLIGDDFVLEVKIPAANTHVRYMLDSNLLAKEKKVQVQGQLLVTERRKVYLVSWHPELPIVIKPVERDEKFINLLRAELGSFCLRLKLLRSDLEQKFGPFPAIIIPSEHPPAKEPAGPMAITDDDLDWCIAQHAKEPA